MGGDVGHGNCLQGRVGVELLGVRGWGTGFVVVVVVNGVRVGVGGVGGGGRGVADKVGHVGRLGGH